jgi:hypothetical protein
MWNLWWRIQLAGYKFAVTADAVVEKRECSVRMACGVTWFRSKTIVWRAS